MAGKSVLTRALVIGALFSTCAVCAAPSACMAAPTHPGKAFHQSLRVIDGTIRAGEAERAASMLAELRGEYPDDRLGDYERLLLAMRAFKLGRLGEVGQILQKMAGSKDGALDPIGDEARSEDIEARIAATVMVGHVAEGAEMLRQCQQPRPGKRTCGAFKAAAHINAFKRGAMARRLLETLAPTRGPPKASYYSQRAESELTSPRGGPMVALAWARVGLQLYPNDGALLAVAGDAAMRAGRWPDVVDLLIAIAATGPDDKHVYVPFTKRTGIAPETPAPPPRPAREPVEKNENTASWGMLALIVAAIGVAVALVMRSRQ
jgi:hypothetical protein